MINLNDVEEILESKENKKLFEEIGVIKMKFENTISKDARTRRDYCNCFKYLLKDEDFEVFVRNDWSNFNSEHNSTPPTNPTSIKLKGISKKPKPKQNPAQKNIFSGLSNLYGRKDDRLVIKRGQHQWGDGITYFANLPGYSEIGGSLLNCIYEHPKVYDEFRTHLTEYGDDVFAKLKEAYEKNDLWPIVNTKTKVLLTNIKEDESRILNVKPGAYFSLCSYPQGLSIYVSNKNFNDKPKINNRWHFDGIETSQTILENIFVNNHIEDFRRGIKMYENKEIKYMADYDIFYAKAKEIIQKYLLVDKF